MVQHLSVRGLCGVGGLLLMACGGRTLQETGDQVAQAETARDGARAPGQALSGTPAQVAASAGGAPGTWRPVAEPEPTVAAAGSWTGSEAQTGDGGMGGGSSSGPQDQCGDPYFPEPGWMPGEWVPLPAGEGKKGSAPMASVRSVMVGDWRGVVRTPWTNPYRVDITFRDNGNYSASTPELGDCVTAFYYGSDDDTPMKQWRVKDGSAVTSGEIDITFDYGGVSGPIEYGLPSWQGELSLIERDASGDGLRFEFSTSDGYGPLRYDLRRVK